MSFGMPEIQDQETLTPTIVVEANSPGLGPMSLQLRDHQHGIQLQNNTSLLSQTTTS